MCTAIERTNAMETLVSDVHCNLPAGVGNDFCSDVVVNCFTDIWGKHPNESLLICNLINIV